MDVLAHLPLPAARRIALRVTPEAERTLRQGHPWLFDRAIRAQSHAGQPGDLAVIFDRKRRFLAIGLYDPTSPIRTRILHHGQPTTIDTDWFRTQLTAAIQLRTPLAQTATDGYRLVHGENDGLPGLVIDRYASTLVVKLDTAAWIPHLITILPVLADSLPIERVVLRLSRNVQAQQNHLHNLHDGMILSGPPLDGPILFRENGLCFEADPIRGQKTGFFLDQRENRATVETLAADKAVLNVFAYTGGFSLYAARAGATNVTSLDISRPALDAAQRNFALNLDLPAVAAAHHELLLGDAFTVLERLARANRQFELVIVDPPSFARKQADVPRALEAYTQLTQLALRILRPGGTVVLASCTSRISADEFYANAQRAAEQIGRPLREFARMGHAVDHPIGFREGAYLKCLFAYA